MRQPLYEAHYQFDPTLLIPVLMIVFMLYWPKFQELNYKRSGKELSAKQSKAFRIQQISGIVFVCFIFSLFLSNHIDMYNKTVGAYRRGEYLITEGPVENFIPMPKEGHARESFQVNGIYFEYSEGLISSAYSNTQPYGGVVRDNQYLKLGYVYHPSYGNIIIYIEEITDPSN